MEEKKLLVLRQKKFVCVTTSQELMHSCTSLSLLSAISTSSITHDGNKDANSSVESGNATLCDMAELAAGGRASREIPLEFSGGLPKKEIMVGIMAVNKLGG